MKNNINVSIVLFQMFKNFCVKKIDFKRKLDNPFVKWEQLLHLLGTVQVLSPDPSM